MTFKLCEFSCAQRTTYFLGFLHADQSLTHDWNLRHIETMGVYMYSLEGLIFTHLNGEELDPFLFPYEVALFGLFAALYYVA